MVKYFLASFLFAVVWGHCSSTVPLERVPETNTYSEAKSYVLGKWESVEKRESQDGPSAVLEFRDNGVLTFYFCHYVQPCPAVEYKYMVSKDSNIEIDINYRTSLIVRKIDEGRMVLAPFPYEGGLNPPIIFFYKGEFRRQAEAASK